MEISLFHWRTYSIFYFVEQKAPRSQIGMMRTAMFSGYGDQFHKEKNGFIDMVDVEDEGVEGTITGVNPNTFKEHNNNMKLNAKFIGTKTPLTPSSVETEFTDPNAVQDNNMSNEKRTVTSGFSADMQGTTVNDTPTTNAELNGRVPNGNIQTNITGQPLSTMGPTTSAVVHDDLNQVPKEKSINPIVNDTSRITGETNGRVPNGILQTDMKGQPVGTLQSTTTTPAVIPNAPNRVQREKSINPTRNQIEPTNTSSAGQATDKKTAIATVNPYTDENPKTFQDDEKREDKMRKSVSFATDNPLINANESSNNVPPGPNNSHNTSIPGTVPEGPIITLPREPSNLMPPRDTTLPEIDLSKF